MSTAHALIHVHDLTNNPLAIIPLGKAKVKIGFVRVIHPIDLIQISNTIEEVNREVQRSSTVYPLCELLVIKSYKLYETFLKLQPISRRQKRWNSIGTAWKWIAGSPDAEDLRIINNTLNSLITQNNKQILINHDISSRIQEVTQITNEVLNLEAQRLFNHSKELNQLMLLSNIDSLQNQIETLEEAILMAKHGIPSSKILTMRDFNKIVTFLEKQDIYIASFEELLSKSTAQVTLNSTHIAYILKVPQFSKEEYDYDYIDSIIRNDRRILLTQNYIIKNDSHIFEIKNSCREEDTYFTCEPTQIEPSNICITQLINGQHSNCKFEKVYINGIIKRIDEATILVNNAITELSSNCTNTSQLLNGSYLIQFEQCNLRLNGELYANAELKLPTRPYYPTTGLQVIEESILDRPPTEYLKNLTLQHRDKMQLISLQNKSLTWKINLFGSLGLTTIFLIIGAVIIVWYLSRKPAANKLFVSFHKEDDAELKEIINHEPPTALSTTDMPEVQTKEPAKDNQKEIEQFLNIPTPYRTKH